MRSQFDTAPCVLFSFTDTGLISSVNDTMCSLLGYAKTELKGQNIEILLPISSRIFYNTHFFPLLKMSGEVGEIFMFLRTKSEGQVPLLMNATRKETEDGPQNICAGITVYNRKKFEDELINSKKAMQLAIDENTELV